jgi:3-oxoacyl-[acyl-carrier-protein] synthase III
LESVPVAENGTLPDLVRSAVDRLAEVIPNLPDRIGAVVFAHSVPTLAPDATPFLDLCLSSQPPLAVPRIAVGGQPCSILHMAVQLAGAWLEELDEGSGVLLLGADRAYSASERVFFRSAMGDSAVAGLVTLDARNNHILASISDSEIIAVAGELSPEPEINRFRNSNPLRIRQIIHACLAKAHVSLNQVAFIVPHTPYLSIWDMMAKLLPFPRHRILTDYIGDTGHLNSNDSFVHYVRAVHERKIISGDLALLINPGFGGTRGCTLVRR